MCPFLLKFAIFNLRILATVEHLVALDLGVSCDADVGVVVESLLALDVGFAHFVNGVVGLLY